MIKTPKTKNKKINKSQKTNKTRGIRKCDFIDVLYYNKYLSQTQSVIL